jgi:hypothetical protein
MRFLGESGGFKGKAGGCASLALHACQQKIDCRREAQGGAHGGGEVGRGGLHRGEEVVLCFVLVQMQDELNEYILSEGKGFQPSQCAEGIEAAESSCNALYRTRGFCSHQVGCGCGGQGEVLEENCSDGRVHG